MPLLTVDLTQGILNQGKKYWEIPEQKFKVSFLLVNKKITFLITEINHTYYLGHISGGFTHLPLFVNQMERNVKKQMMDQ